MKDHALHIDFEAYSKTHDLKDCGLHVWVKHADLWCMGYAFDDEEPQIWKPGQILPDRIRYHAAQGNPIYSHNFPFEYEMWNGVAALRYDFPIIPFSIGRCTMAMAYAMALPGSLEEASAAVGITEQKDMAGHRVMLSLSRGQKATPENLEKLYEYCKKDIKVERELKKRLTPLSANEQKVWELDHKINSRGIRIDGDSIRHALRVVASERQRLDREISDVTSGAVEACSQVTRLKDWVEFKLGRQLESCDKSSVLELIQSDSIDGDVRRALLLRQEAAKSSVAKLEKMLSWMCDDGRIRGFAQYHGASTGRWAARGPQFHNLPRMKCEPWEIDSIFELLKRDDAAEAISLFHGPPMQVISNVLRAFIVG